ncbi:MAG TPA: hypothetical protein PK733_15095 [Clostridiales bacterium]|nr:hypothetical protein [Clostridiales bacterium]
MKLFKTTYLRKFFLILSFAVVLSILATHAVSGTTMEPGSDEDPLVTKSYVDSAIGKLGNEVSSKIGILQSDITKPQDSVVLEKMAEKIMELSKTVYDLNKQLEEQSKYSKFEVVEMEAGQKIILGDSSEIILRAGKALAIAGEKGDGLADITTDDKKNSLVTDDIVPLNHLLLVSRDDGRGIKAVTKIWVLVKGDYTIIEDGNQAEDSNKVESKSSN